MKLLRIYEDVKKKIATNKEEKLNYKLMITTGKLRSAITKQDKKNALIIAEEITKSIYDTYVVNDETAWLNNNNSGPHFSHFAKLIDIMQLVKSVVNWKNEFTRQYGKDSTSADNPDIFEIGDYFVYDKSDDDYMYIEKI